jgi:hypothetical protein
MLRNDTGLRCRQKPPSSYAQEVRTAAIEAHGLLKISLVKDKNVRNVPALS